MANYRKVVRDNLVSVLSHATNGFNAKFAALAASYGVVAFTLDWGANSKNVAYSFLNPEAVEVSTIIHFPGLVVFTSSAQDERGTGGVLSRAFSGTLFAHLQFYLQFRALTDIQTAGNAYESERNTENIVDAVEDAATAALALGSPILQPAGVTLANYRVDRDAVVKHGDGHSQRVMFTLTMKVHAS